MHNLRHLAVAVTVLWLLPTANRVEAANYRFLREMASESIWVSAADNNHTLIGEWRPDGSFINDSDAFNRFNYRDQSVFASLNNFVAAPYAGGFGILTRDRFVYRRDANGVMQVEPIFNHSGPTCHEKPGTFTCAAYGIFTDTRGLSGMIILDENQLFKVYYWDQGAFRRSAPGVETVLENNNVLLNMVFFSGATLIWSSDQSAAMMTFYDGIKDLNKLDSSMNYRYYDAIGPHDVNVTIQGANEVGVIKIFSSQGNIYAIGLTVSDTGGQGLSVLRVDAPFSAAPKTTEILAVATDALGYQPLIVNSEHLYFAHQHQLMVQAFTAPKSSVLADCHDSAPVLLKFNGARESPAKDPSFWVGCGSEVLNIDHGVVVERHTMHGDVTEGAVFTRNSAASESYLDIVVGRADGTIERLNAAGKNLVTAPIPIAMHPEFSVVWEEVTGPCGSSLDGTAIYCRMSDIWQKVTREFGTPILARRSATGWWLTSQTKSDRQLYFLLDGGSWTQLGSWPGKYDILQLIPDGESMAVNAGDGKITRFVDGRQVPAFPFPAANDASGAVISDDNLLYVSCASAGGKTNLTMLGKRADGQNLGICAEQLDGTVKVVDGILAEHESGFTATVLRRGVLITTNDNSTGLRGSFVVRGHKAIALGDLYGEFSPYPNNYIFLSFAEVSDGQIAIKKDDNGASKQSTTYIYDGKILTPTSVTPSIHPLNSLNGTTTTSSNTGYNQALQQIWRGSDGVWRALGGNAYDPISYGHQAVDAWLQPENVAPNIVHAAVKAGNQVLAATDDGIWSCPLDNANVVVASTIDLKQTRGCRRLTARPYVQALQWTGTSYVALQGARVIDLGLQLGKDQVTTLSTELASLLNPDGRHLVWLEGKKVHDLQTRGPNQGVMNLIDLPNAARHPKSISAEWLCAREGLFYLNANSAWQIVAGITRCNAMLARGSAVDIATEDKLLHCDEGSCAAGTLLPANFEPDGVLGELGHGKHGEIGVVLGNHLYSYRSHGDRFVDITPAHGEGSLLIGGATGISPGGVVSLLGGGIVVRRGEEVSPLQVRIQ